MYPITELSIGIAIIFSLSPSHRMQFSNLLGRRKLSLSFFFWRRPTKRRRPSAIDLFDHQRSTIFNFAMAVSHFFFSETKKTVHFLTVHCACSIYSSKWPENVRQYERQMGRSHMDRRNRRKMNYKVIVISQ